MKPYDELTHRGKMRRMRRLAEAALDAYGLADAPLRLFIDNGNIIYRVKDVRMCWAPRTSFPHPTVMSRSPRAKSTNGSPGDR